MEPIKIDLKPYIENPDLCITEEVLESLKRKYQVYQDLIEKRPEFFLYLQEIEEDIKDVETRLKRKEKTN